MVNIYPTCMYVYGTSSVSSSSLTATVLLFWIRILATRVEKFEMMIAVMPVVSGLISA
jgi:hypothetical protein